jgi:hypothetical protein
MTFTGLVWLLQTHRVNNAHNFQALLFTAAYWQFAHQLQPILHGAVLPEKVTGSQLVNEYHTFYGTRRFITAFTSAHHLSLS